MRLVDPTNATRLASTDSVAVDTLNAYDVQHKLIDTATTPAFTSSGPQTTTNVSMTSRKNCAFVFRAMQRAVEYRTIRQGGGT